MHRLTAKFLLLFSLLGTFAPLVLSATAPVPACCVRKGTHLHHCHEAATSESSDITVSAFATCSHDCCRGAVTSQAAHPQSPISSLLLGDAADRPNATHFASPITLVAQLQSVRGPPLS